MASLALRTGVLGESNAAHLLRRATYRLTRERLKEFSAYTAEQAVNKLFEPAPYEVREPLAYNTNQVYIPTFLNPNATRTANPDWNENSSWTVFIQNWWLRGVFLDNSIYSKLSFWLHSIFVIDVWIGAADFSYDYLNLCGFYAGKSIKTFAKKICRLNAMHMYLNNNLNTKANLNQNFAREFLELFTIMRGAQKATVGDYTNYTEDDVRTFARVMSGFTNTTVAERMSYLDNECKVPLGKKVLANHDTTNKTFSYAFQNTVITGGQTEAGMDAELDSFVDVVFRQSETAKNYARRLYRHFVRPTISAEIETDIITPLANNLVANDYDVKTALSILLKSVHFYDEDDATANDEIIGAKVKSPLELLILTMNYFNFNPHSPTNAQHMWIIFWDNIQAWMYTRGMENLRPPRVQGYQPIAIEPYDKQWIDASSVLLRLSSVDYIDGMLRNKWIDAVALVKNTARFSNPADAKALVEEMMVLCLVEIPQDTVRYTKFTQGLLSGLSARSWQGMWETYLSTNIDTDVRLGIERLIKTIVKSPEYQLF